MWVAEDTLPPCVAHWGDRAMGPLALRAAHSSDHRYVDIQAAAPAAMQAITQKQLDLMVESSAAFQAMNL